MTNPVTRLDAPYLLGRALEYLIPVVQEAQYPELKSSKHVPISIEGGAGADSITQVTLDFAGRAKITSSPGDDPGLVGLRGEAYNQGVKSIEFGWRVDFQEARAAAVAGINVSNKKALAAGEIVDRESNRIAYLGEASAGLYGLFTFPPLPKIQSTIQFDDPALDPIVALAQLNVWTNMLYDKITKRVFKPDSVLLPSRIMTWLNTTYRNANSDVTIMDLWRKGNPFITFVDDAGEADEGGFGGTPAILFYKKDPAHVNHFIPQYREQLIHEQSETHTTVLVHQRDAGVFYSRLSALVVENVLRG